MVEKLRLNFSVPDDHCAICTMEPIGEYLALDVIYLGEPHHVLVCHHCLSEHAPEALAEIPRSIDDGIEVR